MMLALFRFGHTATSANSKWRCKRESLGQAAGKLYKTRKSFPQLKKKLLDWKIRYKLIKDPEKKGTESSMEMGRILQGPGKKPVRSWDLGGIFVDGK